MNASPDRLYELLPVAYRMRDADRGYPLRALLQVISEQVNMVEADIEQLYENWFIETCESWVVPYIADLIGHRPLVGLSDSAARSRRLIPRREVANTIRSRRRKGTIAVLEELAHGVADWPARAVELYRLLAVTQSLNHRHLHRGRTVDVHDGAALAGLGGPFDRIAHNVDVRRPGSKHRQGIYNIPSVGVFVWRLQSYPITHTPAYCFEEKGANCFLFSALGNDTALFTPPGPSNPPHPVGELDVPDRIGRRAFERSLIDATNAYYDAGTGLQIWVGPDGELVSADKLIAADLSNWVYRPPPGRIAVDPVLGRMVFAPGDVGKQDVRVSYHYGFSADLGGGEYDRPVLEFSDAKLYRVGKGETLLSINAALAQWRDDQPAHAVIEIVDGGVYVEPVAISLATNQMLQLRAADRTRPVLRLLDWQTAAPDNLSVSGEQGSWFALDGIVVTGRGMRIEGDIAGVAVRHSTLVPGWGLTHDCQPRRPTEPSITLVDAPQCLTIDHSIVGAIYSVRTEHGKDPGAIRISDSIVDATSAERLALGAADTVCAEVVLTISRSTVFGQIQVRAIELAENSILMGDILTCRRQHGCARFCYVTPGSRTPRRYHCQPDLVEQAVNALFDQGKLTPQERDALLISERLRVEPQFSSVRYGTPTYCQLALACAAEIRTGADDESEMGVFHDLYQPQREANLRARIEEHTPAGMDAAILFAS